MSTSSTRSSSTLPNHRSSCPSLAELCFGVICSCMPYVSKFLKSTFPANAFTPLRSFVSQRIMLLRSGVTRSHSPPTVERLPSDADVPRINRERQKHDSASHLPPSSLPNMLNAPARAAPTFRGKSDDHEMTTIYYFHLVCDEQRAFQQHPRPLFPHSQSSHRQS